MAKMYMIGFWSLLLIGVVIGYRGCMIGNKINVKLVYPPNFELLGHTSSQRGIANLYLTQGYQSLVFRDGHTEKGLVVKVQGGGDNYLSINNADLIEVKEAVGQSK